MITEEEWRVRQRQWAEYGRWTRAAKPPEHPAEQALADVGAILEWIPTSVRAEDVDPERLGVRRMHYLLGMLKGA